jgi:hypothetical protein
LNSNRVTVSLKKALRKGIDPDDYNLDWFDDEEPLKKTFNLNPTPRFTPPDILPQLEKNQIELKKKWLILDEFICLLK